MPGIDIGQAFIAILVLLFSLTVHELAHAWVADRLGDPTARRLGRVSLNPLVHLDPVGTVLFPLIALLSGVPLIGWARPVPINVANFRHRRRDNALVTGAGPASNLLLALLAGLALQGMPVSPQQVGPLDISAPIAILAMRAVEINVLLALFNLVPIPPLDGGNLLAGLLPQGLARLVDAVRPYGFLLIYALMFTGTLSRLISSPYFFLLSWLR